VGVTIRPAVSGDYDAVCALYREADRLHAEHAPYAFLDGGPFPRTREWFDAAIAARDGALVVAELDGGVAGLVRIVERHAPGGPPFVPRRFVMVEEIVVRGDRKRRGIGRQLMTYVDTWARERGIDEVELTVWAFNDPAQALFTHLGYTTVQHRMRHTLVPEERRT
jgi:diamine N-acetyltransferase